jgi:hypothetical protein
MRRLKMAETNSAEFKLGETDAVSNDIPCLPGFAEAIAKQAESAAIVKAE